MTDVQITIWLIIMLFVGCLAVACLIWFGLEGGLKQMPKLLGTGLIILTVGLAVQITRSAYYFEFGMYPIDRIFPMWILKDLGGSMIIYYFVFFWKREIK